MEKEGICKKCGKKGKVYYFKGFWYCSKCFRKLTAHMRPFSEVFS